MTGFLDLSTSMTLNDHEPQKYLFLVNFLRFPAATHILRVNSAEMAGHGPGQPVYVCMTFLA